MGQLSIVNICRWNFENPYIRSQVIRKNPVFGDHFEFFQANRCRFLEPNVLEADAIFNEHMPLEF